jgi:3-hydroxybutyryl-CoA dehydrogenase
LDGERGQTMMQRKAAVVGGGRMGLAIGHLFATAGRLVTVVEPNAAVRTAAVERLRAISQARGTGDGALAITVVADLESVPPDAEIVIEAAPEYLELKMEIFARLDAHCSPQTILTTNTSAIPITRIAAAATHRERVVGTHFWNPPYTVRLVEVVQAAETSLPTIERTMQLLAEIGQEPVHVKRDIPGFIGNRMQHALKREAIALVQAGVCDAETVDFVVKHSFGARLGVMGPLEQSDLVGLDLTLAIQSVLLSDLDVSNAPQQLLVDLVAAGKTGVKSGQGFHTWTEAKREALEKKLDALHSTQE